MLSCFPKFSTRSNRFASFRLAAQFECREREVVTLLSFFLYIQSTQFAEHIHV